MAAVGRPPGQQTPPVRAYGVVVPVRALSAGKSRTGLPAGERATLVAALARDVVTACLAAPGLGLVVVVTQDVAGAAGLAALGAQVVADPAPVGGRAGGAGAAGLDAAVLAGQRRVVDRLGPAAVLALPGDLPCLRPADVSWLAAAVPPGRQAVVADADGSGTAALAAPAGVDLTPRFGPGSRAAHAAAGAVDRTADAPTTLRRDVDTTDDLLAAVDLGAGPHTLAWLRVRRGPRRAHPAA